MLVVAGLQYTIQLQIQKNMFTCVPNKMLYDNLVAIISCMVLVSVVYGLTNKPSKEYEIGEEARRKDEHN